MSEAKQKPIHRIRCGSVSAAIWQNDSQKGPFLTASVERTYREGDDFKSSSSFAETDLAALALVAADAARWIADNRPKTEESAEAA